MDEESTPVTVKSAFSSLKAVGYPRSYIEKLLPDWVGQQSVQDQCWRSSVRVDPQAAAGP